MDKPLKNVKVTLYTEDGEIATLHTNPEEEAESKKFLERNRIVSGLSLRSFSNRSNS